MPEAIVEHMLNTILWVVPVMAMLGVAGRMLHNMTSNGSYTSFTPHTGEQAAQARRERAQRQVQRATYLERLSQREIEPDAAPSEPDWVTPVYPTGDTYEQPPASWATSPATYHQRPSRAHEHQFWIDHAQRHGR